LSRNISYLPILDELRNPFGAASVSDWTDVVIRVDQQIDLLDLIKATGPREGDDNEG
jgi:hypothetical protein